MDARQRTWLSLEGPSVSDAFGQRFFVPLAIIARRELPRNIVGLTDDAEMALWRTQHDSNVWPSPSEGDALSS